jgi:hypothetical protein
MELYSGPKMAKDECGKTIDTGTIDRGSTVFPTLNEPAAHTSPPTPLSTELHM